MAKPNRDQEKKRRRQKRLEKKHQREPSPPAAGQQPEADPLGRLEAVLRNLEKTLQVPWPTHWPGASDPSLQRPDLVKLELAEFATMKEPGRSKIKLLEQGLKRGLLGFLPELDHWGIEEFFWHGLPGDSWHPIDAFLAHAGDRFPPTAQAQLRHWKEARLGLYEIGTVQEETVGLRAWDPVSQTAADAPVRAITLNIGGVNIYGDKRGQVSLTYLAPWVPADNLFCGLGYGMMVPKREATFLIAYLGLRHPEVVARPLPWKENRAAADAYLRQWRTRDWHRWFSERLLFPFLALISLPPNGKPELKRVEQLVPSTAEQVRQFGIYMDVRMSASDVLVAGATNLTPIDVTSPNTAALAEYKAYRDRVGPPPGMRGQPPFFTLE